MESAERWKGGRVEKQNQSEIVKWRNGQMEKCEMMSLEYVRNLQLVVPLAL